MLVFMYEFNRTYKTIQKEIENMERKNMIYGYARISTKKQVIERQIANIKEKYPDACIISEEFTGTKIERPKFSKLIANIQTGDTIVFDEVSRMSRNAEEGFKLYRELYEKGVNLIFLKEPHINTDVYKNTAKVATVGNDIADIYIEATNKVLMLLAEKQIKIAFETAQAEVDFLHKRTSEGMRINGAGEKIRKAKTGKTVITKKNIESKEKILKHSKDFGGSLNDKEVLKLTGLNRNTYYKYKRELKQAAEG